MRTFLWTALAMVAFAGNSILCRMALEHGAIDPWSFTGVRLASGALALLPFVRARAGARPGWKPRSALALFAYALCFSLAYVTLQAGTGALLLFGSVQVTMVGVGWLQGERPRAHQILGLMAALAGVVMLVAPGVSAPHPTGALFMVLSGIAWGAYSLFGRGAENPARDTARNFLFGAPFAVLAIFVAGAEPTLTQRGVLLAIASGAATSGLGYVVWYAALRGHSATSAAAVQLVVPALAALGGVALLGETLTPRLVASGSLTLGGVWLAMRARRA